MDDKSPNSTQSSIDDLVKELSRPQSAPPSVPRPNSTPSQPLPTAPKPAAPIPPKPPVSQPVTPNSPKEYQSSIRTMGDDLSRIKSGQQLQGTSVPRKVEPSQPLPTAPKPAAPIPPKPVGPTIQANLGQTQKATPLAPSPIPPKPVPPPAPPVVKKDQYTVPPVSPSGKRPMSMPLVAILVGVVALAAAYWYFMIRVPAVTVVEEPTPTLTPTPSATPVDVLGTIFPDKAGTIILPATGDPVLAFNTALNAQAPVAGKLAVLSVANSVAEGSAQAMDAWELMDRFLVSYPQSLRQATSESVILLYGQKESFDAQGRLVANSPTSSRIVLVAEVQNQKDDMFGLAEADLLEWEPTMTDSLTGLLGFDKTKNTGPFADNTYQGRAVRYKNFPSADRSIDYAIVRYGLDKYYLVLSNSRESVFSAIDAFQFPGK